MNDVVSYIEKHRKRFLEQLMEYLRIPSISTDSAYKEEVSRAAEFTGEQLEQAGMTGVRIQPTPGHPLVYGERIEGPDRPTLLVYGHYDVQPPDPVELWESGPFDPQVRDGRLYARGAADDKGQVFIHFKSAEAYLQVRGSLPVNLKFLIEGEEEIGSPNLDAFVESNRALLKADAVMISDTAMFARGIPSICYGLRGLAYFQLNVRGARQDLHSGSFGGPVGNPAFALSAILTAMKDEHGKIQIPGFYDDVVEPTAEERREFARLPFEEETYRRQLGVPELNGEKAYTALERAWVRPTFEVNGLLSGFTGEGAKTVLPSSAMAKVSMRLVPNQDPEKVSEAFEDYVRALSPPSVRVEVVRMHGGRPWVAPLDHPALRAAKKALEQAFGKTPVFQREGGSIPVVATFAESLNTPSVLMGIGLPDENAHAPNENLDLDNFYRGIKASAHFYDEFSRASMR